MKRNINPPETKERSTQMKTRIRNSTHGLLLMSLLLVCFALLPRAQAFTTDPDETFTNFNTAAGLEASLANTGTGASNTAYGARALKANTTGSSNLGLGGFALINNLDGFSNTAVGNNAMFSNQSGDNNMALGQGAMGSNVSGNRNVAMGAQALAANVSQSDNVAVGFQALASNTNSRNVAIGAAAMTSNTSNSFSVAVGFEALRSLTAAGTGSTAVGFQALRNATSATGDNTAFGDTAGDGVTSGARNIIIGGFGSGNGGNISSASNTISIGSNAANVSNACFIGRIRGVVPTAPHFVGVEPNGQIVDISASSRRFKKDIAPIDKVSEGILALKPVRYHFKNDDSNYPQFGLIAEDVAEVNPDWITHDSQGEIDGVRYEMIPILLLNEFLKEHKKVEEQQASIADLKSTVALQQKEMQVLTAQLKEQAAQIQRVSAQLEVNKAAPRTVANK
jgi:hypothetical protein